MGVQALRAWATYSELERFNEANSLMNGAAHREIIDSYLSSLKLLRSTLYAKDEDEPEYPFGID